MPGQLEQIFTASKNSLADRQHSGNFPNRLQWNLRPLPESQAHRGPLRRDDPALIDRLNWREGNPECKREPEEYFKKIYYDTAGPIRAAFIKLVYDTVGADQILFGSDYPHGRGGRDDQFYPLTLDAMNQLDIPKAEKE